MKKFDVIIIGAGPAGIFAGIELVRAGKNVCILEKGRSINKRKCLAGEQSVSCVGCNPCDIMSGWGGAGAFSDGKMTLTTAFGGVLDEYIGKQELQRLIEYIDNIYVEFGAPDRVFGSEPAEKIRELKRKATAAELQFLEARIRHLGTDNCMKILKRMYDYLEKNSSINCLCAAKEIVVADNKVVGVRLEDGRELYAEYVIAAPGREGAEWFSKEATKLNLTMTSNAVDIGVRVELPAVVLEDITEVVYESKLIYHTKTFDDEVRTFCMNPYGAVVTENTNGLITVNGHSYAEKRTDNTNFALLVSKKFTEPFKEPIKYGKEVAGLANLIGGGVIVQRLGDLLSGRRSTPERIKRGMVTPTLASATPGDLSLVLPYRHLTAIIEMLAAMDKLAPGVNSKHTLLYGVEVKFYSNRLQLTNKLETQVSNLFAVGDGAGVTRGLAQASAAGVLVATEIISR
ncbi:MAG: NAD(P)/FAD-dependent oxidoreductase [Negativicutes bacterium]|jgi:hypothetical protein